MNLSAKLFFINGESFSRICNLENKNNIELSNYVVELADSLNNFVLPKDYHFFHDYSSELIDKCKTKANQDIEQLKNNIDLLNKSEEWKEVFFNYIFEFKTNLFSNGLWFLPSRIDLTNELYEEFRRKIPELANDLNDYNQQKKIEILSDENIGYFEVDITNYKIEKNLESNNIDSKFNMILDYLKKSRNNVNLKLIIEVYY